LLPPTTIYPLKSEAKPHKQRNYDSIVAGICVTLGWGRPECQIIAGLQQKTISQRHAVGYPLVIKHGNDEISPQKNVNVHGNVTYTWRISHGSQGMFDFNRQISSLASLKRDFV